MRTSRVAAVAAALLATGLPVHALGLAETWRAAEQNDHGLAAARQAREAALQRREFAASLWKPWVGLVATVGAGQAQTESRGANFTAPGFGSVNEAAFATSVTAGTATRWSLNAVQPLYDPQRRLQQRQIGIGIEMAELQWQLARQDALLLTAQRYEELALAEQSLRVLQGHLEALQHAADEAADRFRLGASPVTDRLEAQARLAEVRAQWVAARTERDQRRKVLADSTGLAEASLDATLPASAPALEAGSLDAWQAEAEGASPLWRLRRLAAELAAAEADRHRASAQATVALVAQAGRDRLAGHGDFGSSANTGSQRLIGVQLSLPLYTGGGTDARLGEALRQAEQAREEAALARQQLAQQVQAAWLELRAAAERVSALEEGVAASTERREATALGRRVGHRTNLELLQAENDLAAARLALARAQVSRTLAALRLSVLAGRPFEQALAASAGH